MILLLQGCQISHGIFDKQGRGSTYLSVYCLYLYVFCFFLVVTSCVRRINHTYPQTLRYFFPFIHLSFIIYLTIKVITVIILSGYTILLRLAFLVECKDMVSSLPTLGSIPCYNCVIVQRSIRIQ